MNETHGSTPIGAAAPPTPIKVGIVGHAADKFTPETEAYAREAIRGILTQEPGITLVSGGCHLGGIDIWAEEIARELGLPTIIHRPLRRSWSDGYKPRNMKIAQSSDFVYCIVVEDYPESYKGMTFTQCYHCLSSRPKHVKSGGCWTVKYAGKLGKPGIWLILKSQVPTPVEVEAEPV